MDGEPIEDYLRDEEPPDDAVVVVREARLHPPRSSSTLNVRREYTYRNMPMYSISVSLTVGGWDVSALLAGPLSSRSTFAASTASAVRAAGFDLLPTYDAPHYDLLLATGEYREAEALLSLFGSPEPNPYKRRGR